MRARRGGRWCTGVHRRRMNRERTLTAAWLVVVSTLVGLLGVVGPVGVPTAAAAVPGGFGDGVAASGLNLPTGHGVHARRPHPRHREDRCRARRAERCRAPDAADRPLVACQRLLGPRTARHRRRSRLHHRSAVRLPALSVRPDRERRRRHQEPPAEPVHRHRQHGVDRLRGRDPRIAAEPGMHREPRQPRLRAERLVRPRPRFAGVRARPHPVRVDG